MMASYLKRESNSNKTSNPVGMSLEHGILRLVAPRSTVWANGAFDANLKRN